MKKKILVVFILLLFLTITFIKPIKYEVKANEVTINNFSKEAYLNQEIIISLKLNSLNKTDSINAYKATLEYDENIFEEINQDSFINKNGWENLKYNKKTKEFIAINRKGTNNFNNIVDIKLKVKSNANSGYTNIIIKDIVTSNGRKDILVKDNNYKINIISNQIIIDDEITNKNLLPKEKTKEFKEEVTNSKNRWLLLIIITLLILLIIILIIKLNEDKDKKNNKKLISFAFIMAIISSFILMTSTAAEVYNWHNKGEVNGDKEVNYVDVNLLELHLINLKKIQSDYLINADINGDGKITVTDLTLLIKNLEKHINYEVELTNVNLESYIFSKNKEITLKFIGNVSNGAKISKVTINNQEYPVKLEENNIYSVVVNSGDKAGLKDFIFSDVLLNNDKKIETNYKITVDILKDSPLISNYIVEEDNYNSKFNISFDLIDKDNSLNASNMQIVDENGQELINEEIKKGHNTFSLAAEDQKIYYVKFLIKYDLDSNKFESDNDYSGKIEETKELQLNLDYNFQISNLGIYQNNQLVNKIAKNEAFKVGFYSQNNTKFIPSTIKTNDQIYKINKENDLYTIDLEPIDKLGAKIFNIEEIILDNGKKIILDNQTITFEVIKQKPIIQKVKITENSDDNKLNINFTINDEDKTLKDLSIILFDNNLNQLDKISLTEEEINNININKSLNTKISSKYIVKVIASYNQSENEDELKENVTIYETEIKALAKANIINASVDKLYVGKSGFVTLNYRFESNKIENISYIKVNDSNLEAKKLDNGDYQVVYQVGNNSGITNLKATSITFSDQETAQVNNMIKVDVLKEEPTLIDYYQEDNLDKKQVILHFNIKDDDNSFINGRILLTDENDQIIKQDFITKDVKEVTYDVENAKLYKFKVLFTYDLDSNSLENTPIEDNRIVSKEIKNTYIQLISDYELTFANLKAIKNNIETNYYNKNEDIIISFDSTNISIFNPEYAIINGKKYQLTKNNNTYTTQIDSFNSHGTKNIKVEKLILSNTKQLNVSENNLKTIEILKDIPKTNSFNYIDNDNNTLTTSINLIDQDKALINGSITISDLEGNILKTQELKLGSNDITIDKNGVEVFIYQVKASYDLDTNALEDNANMYTDILLFDEEIDISKRAVELKDIKNITLYKQNDTNISKLTYVNEKELEDLSKFIVEVKLENEPSFYTTIKEYKIKNNKLLFILNYENIVQYNKNSKNSYLEVEFGDIENGIASNIDFDKLIELIKENPNGDYVITKNLDAKNYVSGNAVIPLDFNGTINFTGHEIKNLSRPLFNTLTGATVQNVTIINSKATANGLLSNSAAASTIKNVHIKNATITSLNENGTGVLVGRVSQQSIIENVSATNIISGSSKRTGGLIGHLNSSTLKNSYVEGKVTSGSDGSGGLVGESPGSTIENCYANVTTTFSWTSGSIAGISGYSPNTALRNSLSLATTTYDQGHGYRVMGYGLNGKSSNNYELNSSNLTSNANNKAVNEVSKEDVKNKEFYTKTLGWDEDIWDFSSLANGNYPKLKSDNYQEEIKSDNPDIYIPEYSRISKLPKFKKEREIAYYNMYRLMPFYDAKYYVADGNKLSEDHILVQKQIKEIFTYDENGNWVTALSKDRKDIIKTIRILFSDNDSITYNLNYKDSTDYLVNYEIDGLRLDYTFDKYLVDTNSKVYQYIVNKVKNVNFEKDLATLVEGKEVRTTISNFTKVQQNAEEFALKLMANNGNYNISNINTLLEDKIIQELDSNKQIERLIYAYNHYNRYFDITIGGINMADVVFFDTSLFTNKLSSIQLTDMFVNANASARSTNQIHSFYMNNIKPYTNLSYMDFLEFYIKNLTVEKYKNDPAIWIVDNYDGVIYEEGSPRYSQMRYRIWDHLKHLPTESANNAIPLLLSYHGGDVYILGVPTTVLVGNIGLGDYKRAYPNIKDRVNLLKNFAHYAVPFYDTAGGVLTGKGQQNIMNFTQISFDSTDCRSYADDPNADPAFIGFYEPYNLWITQPASAAAFANGWGMWWVWHHALTDFVVYSHEAIHNQDNRLFLEGYGRRSGAGAEHFTDNFLTQSGGNSGYGVVPNYTYKRPITSTVTTNISNDRINTREKIESYYKGMYDTFAFLDYIEAQAFLQLTPEEQSQIAQAIENQNYVRKTADQFRKMNLQSLDDIWDNHLLIVRGGKAYTTGSMWYLSTAPTGASNKAFFVLNAYQMLADFGYDGYTAYAGNKYSNKTEAELIKILTNDETMTWKKYQLGRYKRVEAEVANFKHLDVDKLIEETLTAMKEDVKNNKPIDLNSKASIYRETLYGYLKRLTNDFETSIYEEPANLVHVSNAQEFIEKVKNNPEVNIILDNDIDFSKFTNNIAEDTIISTFVGLLDGNNHKITGLTKPLFNKVVFGYIKNLTIENYNADVMFSSVGSLAKTTDFSMLENINLNNINISGAAVVGGLVGNINRTTVRNINFNTNIINITNANEVGGLFGRATYSTIKNVHGNNSNIIGNNHVGGIIGNANNINISESSFNGNITAKGSNSGGIAGTFNNSSLDNSYSIGKISGNNYVGGLIGLANNTKIDKSFSNASVKGNNLARTGGLIGIIQNADNTKVTNSISLGRITNGYKFDGATSKEVLESTYLNNYELLESGGHLSEEKEGYNLINKINQISIAKLNSSFYTDKLGFSNNIWDFSNNLPKLKNNDQNNVNEIIVKNKISTPQDFAKINEDPDAIYTLTNDIDFSNYTLPEGTTSVVTTNFRGVLEGNNYTIKNLNNASLFKNFGGTVKDINIKDFINNKEENFVAAFTQESYQATFTNMKFENITLKGVNNVAVVSGMDGRENANSVFDKISINNANVTGTGVYVSTFVGRKYGGSVKNVYVNGNLNIQSTENGGLIGSTHQDIIVDKVIANVNITMTKNTDRFGRNNNGGLIGNVYDIPTIKNSISIGNMTGYQVNNTTINVPKFIGITEEQIINYLTNCYEFQSATGTSSVTSSTNKHLNSTTNITSKDFYKSILHFDETIWNLDNGLPTLR